MMAKLDGKEILTYGFPLCMCTNHNPAPWGTPPTRCSPMETRPSLSTPGRRQIQTGARLVESLKEHGMTPSPTWTW